MKDTLPTNTPATVALGADLSPAVKALEAAYRQIQKRHKDVPNATIVVKRDSRAWGHTTVHHVWAPNGAETPDRYEIMVSGENLARGSRAVAATLLHEAAHARNLANGVRDVDTNGRHNLKFKASAELLGLTVTDKGWHGWTGTELGDESAEAWAYMVKTIDRGIGKSAKAKAPVAPVAVGGTAAGTPGAAGATGAINPPKRGNRNLLKATCECGNAIRLSKGLLESAAPVCPDCEAPYSLA